ncbi:MAG: endonuclease [Bacteroidetes bacterium]|nr:endonuclease [Bacteroidota bacterium]
MMPDKFSYDKTLIQKVWEKALVIQGMDPCLYRKDHCGAIIRRDMYLNHSESRSMGWEIDRIKPVSQGGSDDLPNLQPLQWENNKRKDDEYPAWSCLVKANEMHNNYIK